MFVQVRVLSLTYLPSVLRLLSCFIEYIFFCEYLIVPLTCTSLYYYGTPPTLPSLFLSLSPPSKHRLSLHLQRFRTETASLPEINDWKAAIYGSPKEQALRRGHENRHASLGHPAGIELATDYGDQTGIHDPPNNRGKSSQYFTGELKKEETNENIVLEDLKKNGACMRGV